MESMVQAAKFIDEHSNCDIIDINCGCPVNKVLKANAGSKLLQNPQLIYDIVSNIVKNVSKPVTVKIRSGFDKEHINAVEVAKCHISNSSHWCHNDRIFNFYISNFQILSPPVYNLNICS